METQEILQSIPAYRPPARNKNGALYLDSNEGRGPGAAFVRSAFGTRFPDVARYPRQAGLEERIAARFGISPEQVMVTPGGDSALELCCRVYLSSRDTVAYAVPTFEMLERYIAMTGAQICTVDWNEGAFPLAALRDNLPDPSMVAVVTPNNPFGVTASLDELRELRRVYPRALMLLDLAYADFATPYPERLVFDDPNILQTRTLSKAWGLAGLRVGYVIGAKERIEVLRRLAPPYGVSCLSLFLAEQWLGQGEGAVRAFIQRVVAEREKLSLLLSTSGAQVVQGQGNFVFAYFANAAGVYESLVAQGVYVRRFSTERLSQGLRITCPGDGGEFIRLTEALTNAMRCL